MRDLPIGRIKKVHPYAWLWEPLENDPTFLLRPMFGGRAAYVAGRLTLYFTAQSDDWRGICVCTGREHHASLMNEFPELAPHSVLPKWLYLPENHNRFEPVAARLVELVRRRDPRIGVLPQAKRGKKAAPASRRGR
ncbi:hypothetical protein OH491_05035 [Termitidicoccus mucosus]|uniref:MmcQ/YjbR family DNA-binding protein n=1 Tax=Termitidicoccus mucosus TaxID=1184151 RepID=A0A178IPI0_9BACT|nr:hypothetical protein AW736_04565 [Opitutaceae bacterium TSB47]